MTHTKSTLLISLYAIFFSQNALAFPVMATVGAVELAPLMLGLLLAVFSNKRSMYIVLIIGLIIYLSLPANTSFIRNAQIADERRLALIEEKQYESISQIDMVQPDMSKAISFQEAVDKKYPLVFVNDGEIRQYTGYSVNFVISNARHFHPESVIVTNIGSLGETIANVTGMKWIKGGLSGYLSNLGEITDGGVKRSSNTIDCSYLDNCLRVGVFGHDTKIQFYGYPSKNIDLTFTIEELLLNRNKVINEIVMLSDQMEARNIEFEIYGFNNSKERQGLINIISSEFQEFSIRDYNELEKNDETMPKLLQRFESGIALLDGDMLPSLCAAGEQFLMISNIKNLDYATMFEEEGCELHIAPAEWTMKQDMHAYLDRLKLKKNKKIFGLYDDKSSAFYTTLALSHLNDRDYRVIGMMPLDLSSFKRDTGEIKALYQIINIYDELTPNNKFWFGVLIIAPIALLMAMMYLSNNKLFIRVSYLSILVWSSFSLFISDLTPENEYFNTATSVLLLSILFLVMDICKKRKLILSKHESLKLIKQLKLLTPKFFLIKDFNYKVFARLLRRYSGHSFILRSNELTSENNSAISSGRFKSVIVRSDIDYESALAGWAIMSEGECKPSYVVQEYFDFETTGVVSTVINSNKDLALLFESSISPEGITSGESLEFNRTLITDEEAQLSEDDLVKQACLIKKHIGKHFAAEYGVFDGKVYWLQIVTFENCYSSVMNPELQGYKYSEINHELGFANPLVATLLSRYVYGRKFEVYGGDIYEKETLISTPLIWTTKIVPWSIMVNAIQYVTHHVHSCKSKKIFLLHVFVRIAFLLSVMATLKGKSGKTIKTKLSNKVLKYNAHFGSMYMNLLEISALDIHSSSDNGCTKRVYVQDYVRESSRYSIGVLAGEIIRRAKQNGLMIDRYSEFPQLNGNAKRYSQELIITGGSVLVEGSREQASIEMEINGDIHCLGNQDKDEMLRVRMTAPSLDVFMYEDRISEIVLNRNIAMNSHFVLRCRALGIRLEVQ